MTLAQLAQEIREYVRTRLDDPENAEERDELLQICTHFSDTAVVEWWTWCRRCGEPYATWAETEALCSMAHTQEDFDALMEDIAESRHGPPPPYAGLG